MHAIMRAALGAGGEWAGALVAFFLVLLQILARNGEIAEAAVLHTGVITAGLARGKLARALGARRAMHGLPCGVNGLCTVETLAMRLYQLIDGLHVEGKEGLLLAFCTTEGGVRIH